MRILVVEDETKMAGLLRRGLTEEGYAVDKTTNGNWRNRHLGLGFTDESAQHVQQFLRE